MAKSKREVPEINAGSTADMAFLLLTFFLLTSNMDVNKGLPRLLPPISDEEIKPAEIKERNLLLVKVNSNGRLAINRQLADITELKERVKIFLTGDGIAESSPEVEDKQITGLGLQKVSKGVISLNTDRATSYDMYMAVQNEIVRAYNEVRDEYAMSQFGAILTELSEDKVKAIKEKIPMTLSEAEPTDAKKTK